MKKKILMFLLPALLTGCGGNNITDEPSSTPSEIVKTYEITIKENPNCKISVSKTVASRNETIEVFVTDIKSGYEVSIWSSRITKYLCGSRKYSLFFL